MQATGCGAPYPLAAFNSSIPQLIAPSGKPRTCTIVITPGGRMSQPFSLEVALAPTVTVSDGQYGTAVNVSLPHGGAPQVLVAGLSTAVSPVIVSVTNRGAHTCCLTAGARRLPWPSVDQECAALGVGDTMTLEGPLVSCPRPAWALVALLTSRVTPPPARHGGCHWPRSPSRTRACGCRCLSVSLLALRRPPHHRRAT